MTLVQVARMTYDSHVFRRNQKVWLKYPTGALAAEVCGRYKGHGRYVSAWVQWDSANKPRPEWKTIPVVDEFATRHGLDTVSTPSDHPPTAG